MEDLLREILAPLSPTSPVSAPSTLPLPSLPYVSSTQNAETPTGPAACDDAAPEVSPGPGPGAQGEVVVGMEIADLGMDINMGGEQWTASQMEMQRILETLGEGYDAYQQQQISELDLELGWDAFAAPEGMGVGVF